MTNKNSDNADVGTHIITYCSKCGHDVNHVVVAHGQDGIVARVKCIVCNSEHKYKKTASSKPSSRRAYSSISNSIKNSSTPTKFNIKLWEDAKAGAKNKVPIEYTINKIFEKDNLIYHSTMGEGIVMKVYDNKIEVIFSSDIKSLVHNRK
ncbi:MAG: hypothetical protein NTY22_01920 [Proteobacteria bacterium]|nr:hypothetical protein [Pseudomonadota bacterium]